ncbi:hypothetical protein Tco_1252467 [Tanacetum coccineum]
MTTPRTSVTSRTRLFIPFIILSDSDDEDTTLPVVSAPLSPDYVSASPDYSPDSELDSEPAEDDLLDEDLTETAESLQTQTAFTSFVQPPFIRLSPLTASPSSPPPLLLPSSFLNRSRSPSPPIPLETMTLRARVETLEQQDMVTQDSLRIIRDRITVLQLRAVAAEQQATNL